MPPAAPESCTVACGVLTYKCEHGGCSCTAGGGARGRCSDGSSAKVVTLGDDGKEVSSRGGVEGYSGLLLLAVVAAHLAVSFNITDENVFKGYNKLFKHNLSRPTFPPDM